MKANEFKRNMSKTLDGKAARVGFKAMLSSQNNTKLALSVFGAQVAASELLSDFNGYVLGLQMTPTMKAKGVGSLGALLQHAVNAARVLKVKVPSNQKKIKPKNTHTFLLTEIARVTNDMVVTLTEPLNVKRAPMTDEEITKAKAKKAKAPNAKQANGKADQLKPKAEPKYEKLVPGTIDFDKLKGQVTTLLQTAYEFCWAVYARSEQPGSPVSRIMEQRVESLKPLFPKGTFDPPPKKDAPKKAPPQKKAKAPAPAAT